MICLLLGQLKLSFFQIIVNILLYIVAASAVLVEKPLKNASKVRENDVKTGPKNIKMFQFDEHAIESIEFEINVETIALVDQVEKLGKSESAAAIFIKFMKKSMADEEGRRFVS